MQNHIIKKQTIEIALDTEVGSFAFQSRLSGFFKAEIIPLMADYLDQVSHPNEIVRIDKLEIDLGIISTLDFERDFKKKLVKNFPEKLREKLITDTGPDLSGVKGVSKYAHPDASENVNHVPEKPSLAGPDFTPTGINEAQSGHQVTDKDREFELLVFFLKTGNLPWWVRQNEIFDIPSLLEICLVGQPDRMKQLLSGMISDSAVWKRLFHIAGEQGLEKVLILFQPQHVPKIVQLAQQLITWLSQSPQLESYAPARIRADVWANVLSMAAATVAGGLDLSMMIVQTIGALSKSAGSEEAILYRSIAGEIRAMGYDLQKDFDRTKDFDPHGLSYWPHLETLLTDLERQLAAGEIMPDLSGADQDVTAQLHRELPRLIQSGRQLYEIMKQSGSHSETAGTPFDPEKLFEEVTDRMRQLQLQLAQIVNRDIFKKPAGLGTKILTTIGQIIPSNEALATKEWHQAHPFTVTNEIYLHNAGLVLLWPYLYRFLETVGLIANRQFKDAEAREKAVFLLHFITFGVLEAPEYELALNKILCGLSPDTPIQTYFEITEAEQSECEDLLRAVVLNWPALKEMSIQGLRSMFLIRDGILFPREGHWVLRAEEQTYDILLDKMPWGLGMIKLPWMERLLFVEWRL